MGAGPGQARVHRAQAVVLAHLSAAREVAIAGAGMGGLVAAARARELGARPVVLEKGDRPGGSMLLSSGVVWRHRSAADFSEDCPAGDPLLQRRIVDELDDGLAWLRSLGAAVVAEETGNPRTTGLRFDPRSLTETLVRAAGDVRLNEPFSEADILATGGFAARMARDRSLLLRASPWSEGDGIAFALARGADLSVGMDEFYGRNLPAAVPEELFVPAAQLYGARALVLDDDGREFFPRRPSWSETDLVQATARLPARAAWYVIDARTLGERSGARTVADMVETARRVGGDVRPGEQLPFPLPASPKLVEPPFTAVRVHAAVTHTLGGLRIDDRARVLRDDGTATGLFAVGADAGGIFTGGYGSGLAAALVFGRLAAEELLR